MPSNRTMATKAKQPRLPAPAHQLSMLLPVLLAAALAPTYALEADGPALLASPSHASRASRASRASPDNTPARLLAAAPEPPRPPSASHDGWRRRRGGGGGVGEEHAGTFADLGVGGCRGPNQEREDSLSRHTVAELSACMVLCLENALCTGIEWFNPIDYIAHPGRDSNCQLQSFSVAHASGEAGLLVNCFGLSRSVPTAPSTSATTPSSTDTSTTTRSSTTSTSETSTTTATSTSETTTTATATTFTTTTATATTRAVWACSGSFGYSRPAAAAVAPVAGETHDAPKQLPHVAHADPPQAPSGGTANQADANLFTDLGPGGCRGGEVVGAVAGESTLHMHDSFKRFVVQTQDECEHACVDEWECTGIEWFGEPDTPVVGAASGTANCQLQNWDVVQSANETDPAYFRGQVHCIRLDRVPSTTATATTTTRTSTTGTSTTYTGTTTTLSSTTATETSTTGTSTTLTDTTTTKTSTSETSTTASTTTTSLTSTTTSLTSSTTTATGTSTTVSTTSTSVTGTSTTSTHSTTTTTSATTTTTTTTATTTPTSTVTSTPTTTFTCTMTSTQTSTATSTATTTATSTRTTSQTSSRTTTATTTATSTQSTTPTTNQCYPLADILFLIDASTSIEEPELGGVHGNFQKLTQFAAGIVSDLRNEMGPNGVRVAVMTFATIPTQVLGYSARSDAAAVAEKVLLDLEHEHRFVFSETNFDVALAAVRTEWAGNGTLTTAIDWARRPEYPAHVVVLTDGKGSPSDADKPVSALARLQAELNHVAWQDPSVTRWAFDVRGGDAASDHGTLNLLASEPSRKHRGDVSLSTRAAFVSTVMADAELCETTTGTTTGTTTPTTTPCHSVRADVLFMLDASDSAGQPACNDDAGADSGWDRARQIAANIVRTVGANGDVAANAVRFAVVAYSSRGAVLFDFDELDHDSEAIALSIEAFTDPRIVSFGADQQPTLPAAGFSTAEAELLLEARGYRGARGLNGSTPLFVLTFSDGRSLNRQNLASRLENPESVFARGPASVGGTHLLAYDFGLPSAAPDVEAERQQALALLGRDGTRTVGCGRADADASAVEAFTSRLEFLPCLTTTTTSATATSTTGTVTSTTHSSTTTTSVSTSTTSTLTSTTTSTSATTTSQTATTTTTTSTATSTSTTQTATTTSGTTSTTSATATTTSHTVTSTTTSGTVTTTSATSTTSSGTSTTVSSTTVSSTTVSSTTTSISTTTTSRSTTTATATTTSATTTTGTATSTTTSRTSTTSSRTATSTSATATTATETSTTTTATQTTSTVTGTSTTATGTTTTTTATATTVTGTTTTATRTRTTATETTTTTTTPDPPDPLPVLFQEPNRHLYALLLLLLVLPIAALAWGCGYCTGCCGFCVPARAGAAALAAGKGPMMVVTQPLPAPARVVDSSPRYVFEEIFEVDDFGNVIENTAHRRGDGYATKYGPGNDVSVGSDRQYAYAYEYDTFDEDDSTSDDDSSYMGGRYDGDNVVPDRDLPWDDFIA